MEPNGWRNYLRDDGDIIVLGNAFDAWGCVAPGPRVARWLGRRMHIFMERVGKELPTVSSDERASTH